MRACVLCDATDSDRRWSHCLRLLRVLILPAALGKCGVTACTVWVGKSYSWSLMMYLYKHGHPPCAIPGNSEPILGTQTPPLVLQHSPGTPTLPWNSNPHPCYSNPHPWYSNPHPGTTTPLCTSYNLNPHPAQWFWTGVLPLWSSFLVRFAPAPLSAINNLGLLPSIQALHLPGTALACQPGLEMRRVLRHQLVARVAGRFLTSLLWFIVSKINLCMSLCFSFRTVLRLQLYHAPS